MEKSRQEYRLVKLKANHLDIGELTHTMGEERRWYTLCDKRDSNFVSTNFPPNFTIMLVIRPENIMLSDGHDKIQK